MMRFCSLFFAVVVIAISPAWALDPAEQNKIDLLYSSVKAVSADQPLPPSAMIHFAATLQPRLFVIHPHLQYDKNGDLVGRIEPFLKNQAFDSFVVLEAIKKPFQELRTLSRLCGTESGESASSVNECLMDRYGIFDPSIDVELETLGSANLSYAWAGKLVLAPESFGDQETIYLTGGFFTNCQKNAVDSIVRAFLKAPQARSLQLMIISDLTIDDSGPLLPNGRRRSILLSSYLSGLDQPGAWTTRGLGEWYLQQLKYHSEADDQVHFEMTIDSKSVASIGPNSSAKTVLVRLVPRIRGYVSARSGSR